MIRSRPFPWPNAFSVVAIALVTACYIGVFGDLDWSWQVRTGEVIVESGTLRIHDSFSYTIHGQPLHDFEWLYEVLLYFTWSNFGIGGLKFLKVLVVFTPLALVFWRLRVGGVKWHGIFLCLALAAFVLAPSWNLRPLFVTTIGLLLLSGLLHDHCWGRRPLPLWTILVMLLWGNMHPGVITGQGLLLGAIGWEWLNVWLKWNTPLQRRSLVRLSVVGGLALLATFVSPDPIERLRYTFKPELAHPIMRVFVEMLPLHSLWSRAPLEITCIYLLAAVVLVTVLVRGRHFRMWEFALLGGTALLGNYAWRSTMDWVLVMIALGVPQLKEWFAERARDDRRRAGVALALRVDRWLRRLLSSPLFAFQARWLTATLALLFVLSVVPRVSRVMPLQNSPEWPVAALDHAEQAGLQGKFFSSINDGAYIGWRLRERGLSYTDTRGFFFPPVLLEDADSIPQLGHDWRRRLSRVLDEYQTDYFLLDVTGPKGKLWQSLKSHIETPLYLDERSVLLSADQVRAALPHVEQ